MKFHLSSFIFLLSVSMVWASEATLEKVRGKVEVRLSATEPWVSAPAGFPLQSGNVIRTGSNGTAELRAQDGHRVALHKRTFLEISSLISSGRHELFLQSGRIRSWVRKLQAGSKFQVRTPTAVIAVRGTEFAVELDEAGQTRVECYEGVVAAKELATGAEVAVQAGEFTHVVKDAPPAPPAPLPQQPRGMTPAELNKQDIRARAEQEIFQEISRQAVIERAAEEIKLAEFQNGKALVDGFGMRVRLEEYVVRPQPNQFKYVVLNTRADRFDFGKILFTFNAPLPADLTQATKNLFRKNGSTPPDWYTTDIISVISNTQDKVTEEASGGHPVADDPASPTSWNTFFSSFKFKVNDVEKWSFKDNGDNAARPEEYTYLPGTPKESHTDPSGPRTQPNGFSTFFFRQKDTYADGTWIQAEDRVINDDGQVVTLDTLASPSAASASDIRNNVLKLNFERTYTASEFQGRKIDLVFSAKLLSDVGIITLPSSLTTAKAPAWRSW